MTKIQNSVKFILIAISMAMNPLISFSQEATTQEALEIDPLFEYPVAPEELKTIEEKSNYLVEHFWDPFDFKNKTTVDQHALNHAFFVYTTPIRYADKTKALAQTDKLIDKISKNPTLLTQFTKAAEENLYGQRAEVWIDEVYIKFLEAIVKNKKVNSKRKEKYQSQLTTLKNTIVGEKAQEFKFIGIDGKDARYFPMSTPTILIFGDPTQSEWRMWRLKLETNTSLVKALEQGKLNIIYIVDSDLPGWNKEVSSYPSSWTVGCAPEISKIYDLRTAPAFYLVGSDGKIILKNVVAEVAVNKALDLVAQ